MKVATCFETHEYLCCGGRYYLTIQMQNRAGILVQLHEIHPNGRYDLERGVIEMPFTCSTPPAIMADWLEDDDTRCRHRNRDLFMLAMRDSTYQ